METSNSLCGIQLDKKSLVACGMVIMLGPELDSSSSHWTHEPHTKMFPLGFVTLSAFAKILSLSLLERRLISRYDGTNVITVHSSRSFFLSPGA